VILLSLSLSITILFVIVHQSNTITILYLHFYYFSVFTSLIESEPISLAQLVIGRDIALYIQGPGFEPRTLHLFTLRVEF
jgi:hypothetical protein